MKGKVERTARQKAALRDAYRLLSAQFDFVLIVCSVQDDHHRDAVGSDPDIYWQGTWFVNKGLADIAKKRLEYSKLNKLVPH